MSAARGAARERKVADELRADGWIVKGTGDAHGAIDSIAVRDGVTRLIQVKGSSVARGRFADFHPDERALFLNEAMIAGYGRHDHIQAWLVWAPADRKPPRWIPPSEWP
jgi:hypothetical protein